MHGRYVFSFSCIDKAIDVAGGEENVHNILGRKGANLALISKLGVPVPKGFTITSEACRNFYNQNPASFPPQMWEETLSALHKLEEEAGKKFGDPENPLIVSCSSGAPEVISGLCPTILFLGLNDETVNALSQLTGNPKFAWNSYRQFIEIYGVSVLGLKSELFQLPFHHLLQDKRYKDKEDVDPDDWKMLIETYKKNVESEIGIAFPQDPFEQIRITIAAVFNSWNSKPAIDFRRDNKISDEIGTAANITQMIFGNIGETSCFGHAFTRDPTTGENKLKGEIVIYDKKANSKQVTNIDEFSKLMPEQTKELVEITKKLEHHFKEIQLLKFIIENGKLWVIKAMPAHCTSSALIKILTEMVSNNTLTKEEALLKIDPHDLPALIQPFISAKDAEENEMNIFTDGIPNSTPACCGQIYFSLEKALQMSESQSVILVQNSLLDEFDSFGQIKGFVSPLGGTCSHPVIFMRQMGVSAIVGTVDALIDPNQKIFTCNEMVLQEGDFITMDCQRGIIFKGKVNISTPSESDKSNLKILLGWADEVRKKKGLKIYANADTVDQLKVAKTFGGEGVGTCRIEHLINREIKKEFQNYFLTEDSNSRNSSLNNIYDFIVHAIESFLKEANGVPTVIRLINPPVSSFLPDYLQLLDEVCTLRAKVEIGQKVNEKELEDKEQLLYSVKKYKEKNPIIGARGARVCVCFPELTRCLIRAILNGAYLSSKTIQPQPYIEVPFTCHENELIKVKEIFNEVKDEVFKKNGCNFPVLFGALIEVPRAALIAEKLAKYSDFFTFGINDLTQLSFCYSRDDSEASFIQSYREWGILSSSPFLSFDIDCLGKMAKLAATNGKKSNNKLIIGVCVEHGSDPATINFFHSIGCDFISCNVYRILIARLAAAQASLRFQK